ncbi:MAG: outer membrane protein OmpA-like peptidoglycan-associated protein/cytochrome c553 [Flavobacteriales bacterium]|jgi:outer membrane protein OmpA-like peptidoglycan-associated protein/cytochrome c553
MRLNLRNISILASTSVLVMSCSRNPDSAGYEYMPDMYRSQAIEAYVDYGMVKDDEIDSLKTKMSARHPAEGTIPFVANVEMAAINMPYALTSEQYEESAVMQIPGHYVESEEVAKAHAADGKELFTSFCMHCHGAKGAGDGAVVTKGNFNAPSPYNGGYKNRTLGQIFHVITYGKGAMGPHGSQLNKDERWKAALYVRSLQYDGDIMYKDIMSGKRIGEIEKVFGDVDLASINKGVYVSLRNIKFPKGSVELTTESKVELDSLASYLAVYPDVLEISGHTDTSGTDEVNVQLSKDRALSVVNYLVGKGVDAGRLTSEGYGSGVPIAVNSTEEGKAKNRRIEFVKL